MKLFDNAALLLRGNQCIVASVWAPFVVAYWPDVARVVSEAGMDPCTAGALNEPGIQAKFLMALANKLLRDVRFRPASIGFRSYPEELRRRESRRRAYRSLSFIGACSRDLTLGALELVAQQVQKGGSIDLKLKGWDPLAQWPAGGERVSVIYNYVHQIRRQVGAITLYSELAQVDSGLWDFVYNHPRVRIAWLGADLAACRDMKEFNGYARESVALRNLGQMSEMGLWPHVVLPVSAANVGLLPELAIALLEATRGGSIEIVPLCFLPALGLGADRVLTGRALSSSGFRSEIHGPSKLGVSPALEDYVAALVAIHRSPRIPLRLVFPLSWVAERVDSRVPMISSPVAAGAELAVLPNGDLYAAESAIGVERWRLGNCLDEPEGMSWERLDVVPEAFSKSLMWQECKECPWRYRCGGMDASVALLEEQRQGGASPCEGTGQEPSPDTAKRPNLFRMYCEPRKRLFEELLWGSVEAAAGGWGESPRERLALSKDGIQYVRGWDSGFPDLAFLHGTMPRDASRRCLPEGGTWEARWLCDSGNWRHHRQEAGPKGQAIGS